MHTAEAKEGRDQICSLTDCRLPTDVRPTQIGGGGRGEKAPF